MTLTISIRVTDTEDRGFDSQIDAPVHDTLAAEMLLIFTSYLDRDKSERTTSTTDDDPALDFAAIIPILIALGASQAVKVYGQQRVSDQCKQVVEYGMRTE